MAPMLSLRETWIKNYTLQVGHQQQTKETIPAKSWWVSEFSGDTYRNMAEALPKATWVNRQLQGLKTQHYTGNTDRKHIAGLLPSLQAAPLRCFFSSVIVFCLFDVGE